MFISFPFIFDAQHLVKIMKYKRTNGVYWDFQRKHRIYLWRPGLRQYLLAACNAKVICHRARHVSSICSSLADAFHAVFSKNMKVTKWELNRAISHVLRLRRCFFFSQTETECVDWVFVITAAFLMRKKLLCCWHQLSLFLKRETRAKELICS